jgi:hypothetical protein
LFEDLVCQHSHVVVLDQLARGLVPFSCAMTQAMLAVAVGAVFLAATEFGIRIAALAERIYLFGGIHNIRGCDIIFIGTMGIRCTMAALTTDIGLRVDGCELILLIVYMAYIAPAVICYRAGIWSGFSSPLPPSNSSSGSCPACSLQPIRITKAMTITKVNKQHVKYLTKSLPETQYFISNQKYIADENSPRSRRIKFTNMLN